ncbi:MAG: hypothetical protein RJB38_1076 [Pseudomonadota bacterium]|jgi:copper chaperone
MKSLARTLTLLSFVFMLHLSAWASGPTQILVEGMTCGGCEKSVKAAFAKLPEVQSVDVQVKTGKVTVTFQPEKSLTEQQLREAIQSAGYRVKKITPLANS